MSVVIRTEVRLVDDSDDTTLVVARREPVDEPPWQIEAGSKVLFVSSADLVEFVHALRDLIGADSNHPAVDPFITDAG